MSLSAEPFSTDAIHEVKTEIALIETIRIDNRIEFLKNLCFGNDILDIGIVEHTYEATKNDQWLHWHLASVAGSSLGIDILEDEIRKLKFNGYNVLCHDITMEPLKDSFDVIIMGELIEHVDAPKQLLFNASKNLKQNGIIVLTTPNPWYIVTVLKAVRRGFYIDNVDHVGWYDPATIQSLGKRCGLSLVKIGGLTEMKGRTRFSRMFLPVIQLFARRNLLPLVDCKSILYVFKRK